MLLRSSLIKFFPLFQLPATSGISLSLPTISQHRITENAIRVSFISVERAQVHTPLNGRLRFSSFLYYTKIQNGMMWIIFEHSNYLTKRSKLSITFQAKK
jgi:hypothetical protein